MPWPWQKDPEDAPDGDPASLRASHAELRTHALTQELLDWLIAALEATLATPQVRDDAASRPRQALRDALKYADYLYPLTLETSHVQEADPVLQGPVAAGGPSGPGVEV